MSDKRTAYIRIDEIGYKSSPHSLTKEFDEVQELIDYIDKYCDEKNMIEVDVTVECEGLTESDIEELRSVWIKVIVD